MKKTVLLLVFHFLFFTFTQSQNEKKNATQIQLLKGFDFEENDFNSFRIKYYRYISSQLSVVFQYSETIGGTKIKKVFQENEIKDEFQRQYFRHHLDYKNGYVHFINAKSISIGIQKAVSFSKKVEMTIELLGTYAKIAKSHLTNIKYVGGNVQVYDIIEKFSTRKDLGVETNLGLSYYVIDYLSLGVLVSFNSHPKIFHLGIHSTFKF